MGQLCGKLHCLPRCYRCCSYCSCTCCEGTSHVSNASSRFKVLLLGASGSGKTQLGHLLSGEERDCQDKSATNGVRCFHLAAESNLLLTEVGGSADMQRIWSHYYASCHALIYCFDLSATYDEMATTFGLLKRCLENATLRGKPVLLVATRHSDTVQLYDVENTFGLESLARSSDCPLHICQLDDAEELWRGVAWLQRQLNEQAPAMEKRIKYDQNMQSWQRRNRDMLTNGKLQTAHRQRFRRRHRKLWPMQSAGEATSARPCTAPAAIFSVRLSEPPATP